MEFRNIFSFIVSILVIFFFILCWGKFKRVMAEKEFKEGNACIQREQYKDAIKHFQNIGDELSYENRYWYNLAIAFTGAGDIEDAQKALSRALKIVKDDEQAIALNARLKQLRIAKVSDKK